MKPPTHEQKRTATKEPPGGEGVGAGRQTSFVCLKLHTNSAAVQYDKHKPDPPSPAPTPLTSETHIITNTSMRQSKGPNGVSKPEPKGPHELQHQDILLSICIPYLPKYLDMSEHIVQPRSDTAERGILSGSTLFATRPAVFRHTNNLPNWLVQRLGYD